MKFYIPIFRFAIAGFFVNFMLFNFKAFEGLTNQLQSENSIWLWFTLIIACGYLTFFSYKIIDWAIQSKFFIQTEFLIVIIHLLILLISIYFSIGLYLILVEGFTINLNSWNTEIFSNLIVSYFFSIISSLAWGSVYKFIKPALNKLDYIKTNELIKVISNLPDKVKHEKPDELIYQLKLNLAALLIELNNNAIYEPRQKVLEKLSITRQQANNLIEICETMATNQRKNEILSLLQMKKDSAIKDKHIESINFFKNIHNGRA
jgi:hypothetical protein